MANSKPINWAYPFKLKATEEDSANTNNATAEHYYQALALAKDGFYPMGASGLWHGGVHFDEGTAGTLEQSAVRCIADGEVIAYRIDKNYPTTAYNEGATMALPLPFSSGFVLVKHRLEPPQPPAPTPAPGTPTAAPTTAPALTFYSLYMHLQDWNGYQASDAQQPPIFLSEPLYSVKASKATDPVLGLRVREHPNSNSTILAILPKGCRVKLGDADTTHPKWRKLIGILEGCAIPPLSGEAERWVYADELDSTEIADVLLVAGKANDPEPTLDTTPKGLKILKGSTSSSSVIGLLPTGAKFMLESGNGAYRKLKIITEGQDTTPLTANCTHNILGYVPFDDLEVIDKTTPPPDEVQLLDPVVSIKAGELIGHVGQYQNFDDQRPRPMLHLQVFTCEDLPSFISQCQALAEHLPAEQKTLAKVHIDTKIAQPLTADTQVIANRNVRLCSDSPKEGRWAKVQQYVELKAKKAGFGSFDSAHNRYPMDTAKKTELATEFDLDTSELPDTVDFLLESFKDDGNDMYSGKVNIPSTHVRRKIGVLLKTPIWVERSQLNSTGQRSSTSATLQAWKTFPLHNGLDGVACGYERILPCSAWSNLDQQHKAIAPDNIHWWYVTVADITGQEISGWVPEQDPILSLHSPWEWPGFSYLKDQQPLDALAARQLNAAGNLTETEAQRYLAQIDAVERGPILSKLYDIIDLPDEHNQRDQKLSAQELKVALSKPWLAQQLSLLLTHYESEWYWSEDKWNALNPLMAVAPDQHNPNWEAEKQRIKALRWWDKLEGKHGFNSDGKAWHFHPVGVISNCIESSFQFTLDMLKYMFPAANDNNLILFIEEVNPRIDFYKLDTPLRRNHFFAQTMQEVGTSLSLHSENLNYASQALLGLFSYFQSNPSEAQLYGRTSEHPANPEAIANRAYANRNGNGNISSGDGWRYRGRGIIQLTGRINYHNFTTWHSENSDKWTADAELDFEDNESLVDELTYAVRSAAFFWLYGAIYEDADTGATQGSVDRVTRKVNPGLFSNPPSQQKTDSIDGRRNNFNKLIEWGGLK